MGSKLAIVLTLLAALAVTVWLWIHAAAVDGVNRETYSRIGVGMTLAEVEEIMGGPGGAWDDFHFRDYDENTLPDGRTIDKRVEWTCQGDLDGLGWCRINCCVHAPGHDGISCGE